MSKTVDSGVLKQLSPSSINKFDSTQAFGCERRWWFHYVKGLDEPQTGNQFLGESLHALIEARLSKQELGMETDPEANGLYLAGESMIEAVAARKILGVEMPIANFSLEGVPVRGFVDCVTSDGIIDWKTSSDIKRYGKTEADLPVDTQMVIYARAFHPTLPAVKLAHGQFQTKGNKRTSWVEVEVSQESLAARENKVIVPLIQKMKSAAAEVDVMKLPRNEKSCFNCAYKTHCPSNEGESVMSFFSKMKSGTPAAGLLDNGSMAVTPAPVAPPDAPESKPELAAKPVAGFTAVPPPKKREYIDVAPKQAMVEAMVEATVEMALEAADAAEAAQVAAPVEVKRKAGRPPGAKNKPKVNELVGLNLTPEAVGAVFSPKPVVLGDLYDMEATSQHPAPSPFTLKSVTVTKGYTINVGTFSGVRFDVSATAEGSDYATVEAGLREYVEASLQREASKYQAEVDAKTKASVPAVSVVCK